MTEAAELGTKKVMEEHSTIGILVSTDGTITDIPRADYVDAERRAIADMRAAGKPFLVLVNSAQPSGEAAQEVCRQIHEEDGAACMAVDCLTMDVDEISAVLTAIYLMGPALSMYFRSLEGMEKVVSCDPGMRMKLPFAVLAAAIVLCGLFSDPIITLLANLSAGVM